MKIRYLFLLVTASTCVLFASSTQAQSSAFTYQGLLDDNSSPASGLYDLRFTIYDSVTNGLSLGVVTNGPTEVDEGVFTVTLDFGADVFDGGDRWLEVGVRTNGASAFNTLSPRQPISSAPYAIKAANARIVAMGTISDPSFIGTTTSTPLEFQVNNEVGFRLEYPTSGTAPNLVGGYAGNAVGSGTEGAIIAGGGAPESANSVGVESDYSTIGGGNQNTIADNARNATIAGGEQNAIASNAIYSVISGGLANYIGSDADYSAVGGGNNNEIGADADFSTISGGVGNRIKANADYGTIAGGNGNSIASNASFSAIVGGRLNTIAVDADFSAIGGGLGNNIASNASYAVIPGGLASAVGSGATASLAAGTRAKANHRGSFVWSDSENADFASTGDNQFLIRAGGGVGIGTSDPAGAALRVAGSVRAPRFEGHFDGDFNGDFTGNFKGNLIGTFIGNGAVVTNVNLVLANSEGAITWVDDGVTFVLTSSPAVGDGPNSVISTDANRDGKPDLITANSGDNTLSILTNNGSGGFALASSPFVGVNPSSVTSTDVNGDGHVDLISADWQDNALSVLTNDGAGGFVLASSPDVGTGPSCVVASDVNGDGSDDLISANSGDNTLSVLTNDGGGNFALASSPGVGTGPNSLVASDVNGDGRDDLISANFNDDSLSILTNDGTGGFVLASSAGVGSQPKSVVATDVNGDGKDDLISANSGDNTLSVLTNDGEGGFVLASSPDVGNEPNSVVASDVDWDGSIDLISANYLFGVDNSLSVLTNDGAGGFALASSLSVGLRPLSVTALDVNGDGKADLVTANSTEDTLSLLLNTTAFNAMFKGIVFSGTFQGDPDDTAAAPAHTWSGDTDSGVFRSSANTVALATGGAERMRITASGEVGIGTTAPEGDLHVQGNTSLGSIIVTPGETNSSAQLLLTGNPNASVGGILRYDGTVNEIQVLGWSGDVATGPLLIVGRDNGRVGIKRTPAINSLEVEGTASKTTSGSWLANSDRRIKTEVEAVTDALDTLNRVRLVSFRYTDDYCSVHPSVEDRRYLNVVAQEFAKVFPEHVKSSGERLPDGSEILQVDTHPLTIYSAAAVQELNVKLERQNAELRKELNSLREVVETLAAQKGRM